MADGGACPAVTEVVANRDIITPENPRVLDQFHVLCEPLYKGRRQPPRIEITRSHSDALLPKLLSGDIRVKEAEKLVGAKVP